jgi:hypothetical protein
MPEVVSEAQTRRADTEETEPVERQGRAGFIKPAQVTAAALAAVTAAVAASKLGVAGTLSGAALGSVVASVGGSVYERSIHRTQARVRTTFQVRRAGIPAPDPAGTPARRQPVTSDVVRLRPTGKRAGLGLRLAVGAVASFAIAIAVITAFELFAGEPVSGLTGGQGGSGTTIGRSITGGSTPQAPEPTPSPSAPAQVDGDQPAAGPSAVPIPTPSASATPEPTPSPSGSGAPSPTPPTPPETPSSPSPAEGSVVPADPGGA